MNDVQTTTLVVITFFTMLGAVLGKIKNRTFLGAVLGNLLGIFGALAICLFNKRPLGKRYTNDEIAWMIAIGGILLFLEGVGIYSLS